MSPYQFTADDADIILRASRCNVPREFRVHKTILSITSPVFKDMFDVPQPVSSETPAGPTVPVIDVDDTPEDLENFLRMIYPFGFPAMPTLDAISHALIIFDKYQVQGGSLQPLRSLLVSPKFLNDDPIRVYSLACGWGFKEEADLAASYTSSLDVLTCARAEDIQRMSGMEYHRILTLGMERRSKGREHILNAPVTCAGCPNYKKFYPAFRDRLLEDFGVHYRTFYDYGGCTIRCFEIAMEMEGTVVELGCDVRRDSHLGMFIRALAEKLSSHS